jgi:hypothetical protein
VVVADFDIERVAIFEPKTDAPLVIDRYRVLAGSVAFQRMEAVTWWHTKGLELVCRIDGRQLPKSPSLDIGRQAAQRAGHPELLGLFVRE